MEMNKKIESIIRACFKVIHMIPKDSTVTALVQFIKFGVVGVTNTVIGYVLNVGTLFLLRDYNVPWDYIVGNIVSFILSVLWSFYWNNKYVFTAENQQKRNIAAALLKTYIAYGFTGIILSNTLSYVWIDIFKISKYVAPLINLIISVPLNFLINKFWAFNEKRGSVNETETC